MSRKVARATAGLLTLSRTHVLTYLPGAVAAHGRRLQRRRRGAGHVLRPQRGAAPPHQCRLQPRLYGGRAGGLTAGQTWYVCWRGCVYIVFASLSLAASISPVSGLRPPRTLRGSRVSICLAPRAPGGSPFVI